MRANSAAGERRYSRRTGTLPNSSRTITRVPGGPASGRGSPSSSRMRVERRRDLGVRRPRHDRHLRDRRDRREPFAAKAERVDAREARGVRELRRCVARDRERQIVRRDPDAVVGDLDLGEPAAAHAHRDARRAGVERVLDELFDDRQRPLDHLAGRDLPDRLGVQEPNHPRSGCDQLDAVAERIADERATRPGMSWSSRAPWPAARNAPAAHRGRRSAAPDAPSRTAGTRLDAEVQLHAAAGEPCAAALGELGRFRQLRHPAHRDVECARIVFAARAASRAERGRKRETARSCARLRRRRGTTTARRPDVPLPKPARRPIITA